MKTDKELSYYQHYYDALLEYDPAVFGSWSKLFEKKQEFSSQKNAENGVEVKTVACQKTALGYHQKNLRSHINLIIVITLSSLSPSSPLLLLHRVRLNIKIRTFVSWITNKCSNRCD
jgi:hypothetical protein